MRRTLIPLLAGCALAWSPEASAAGGRAEVGGYMRVGARPDLQGGNGKLGYWNLYGRLMNEGPWAALEFKYDVLERQKLGNAPYTSLHMKVEGGSISNADMLNGGLSNFRLSQTYARVGNVLIPGVVWQVGTLDTYFGDLGLYDMRPAQIFFETVGLSARYQTDRLDLLLGFGDSGYYIKGSQYNSILTPGGTARVRLGNHVELGAGGQYRYEPMVEGNRNAPHVTPDVDYEDWIRGEVVRRMQEEDPLRRDEEFPFPEPTDARSWKAIGYLGFGGLGPIKWNNTFVSYEKLHPKLMSTETYNGIEYTIYTQELTDERTALIIGDELQLVVWPRRVEVVLAGLYGNHQDGDNDLAPSDYDRWYWSTVLRPQIYLTDTFHLLIESSFAQEVSRNGNNFREHVDSVFTNTGGLPDSRGLEYGDTDTRYTWQGKGGFNFNPLGPGAYVRPSLRILYGVQYSNQNNAFGNSFVDNIDQFNEFGNVERHWHHVLSLETEAWF
ncbi:MAG: hypothetical protein H6741_22380 [Alphaproteobacteria bacterium]|nr:hypothetical protein [Alphaproteobacteria bacterium]